MSVVTTTTNNISIKLFSMSLELTEKRRVGYRREELEPRYIGKRTGVECVEK